MKININVCAAVKYGLEAAILLQNFFFWINHNIQKKINEKDGKFWTFTSINKLLEKYPFLSTGKIRSALETLVEIGILIKGNYNKNLYNKTTWYAFKDDTIFNEIRSLFDEEKESNETKKKEIFNETLNNKEIPLPQESNIISSEKENVKSPDNSLKEIIQTPISNDGKDNAQENVCNSDKSICKFNKSNNINKANINIKLSLNNLIFQENGEKKEPQDNKKVLTGELLKRGITIFQVYGMVKNYDKEYITTKIKQFDYILSHFPERMKNNKGRYLFMSIKDNWIDETYEKVLLNRKIKENEEKSREEQKLNEKLKQEYDLFIENECKTEYLTLSDEEKELIDIEIKKELDKSAFIRSNELLYLAGLEAKRVLFVMDRVKTKALSFDEFSNISKI